MEPDSDDGTSPEDAADPDDAAEKRAPTQHRVARGSPARKGSAPWMAELFDSVPYTCGDLQTIRQSRERAVQLRAMRAFDTRAGQCFTGAANPALRLANSDAWPFSHACGGNYIGQGWVVTAAHCFLMTGGLIGSPAANAVNAKSEEALFKSWKIRLGTMDISKPGQVFTIEQVVVHKDFEASDRNVLPNDIAMVHLADMPETAPPSPIRAIIRARKGMVALTENQPLRLTGWGSTTPYDFGDPNRQPAKLKAWLQVAGLNVSRCDRPSSNPLVRDYYARYKASARAFCAQGKGPDAAPADACQGDSGGPVTVEHRRGTQTLEDPADRSSWLLVGIVSRGPGCGMPDSWGVYTDVAAFANWIDRVMKSRLPRQKVSTF